MVAGYQKSEAPAGVEVYTLFAIARGSYYCRTEDTDQQNHSSAGTFPAPNADDAARHQ